MEKKQKEKKMEKKQKKISHIGMRGVLSAKFEIQNTIYIVSQMIFTTDN